MGDRGQNDGGLSCLGCGGCLTLFVIVIVWVFVLLELRASNSS